MGPISLCLWERATTLSWVLVFVLFFQQVQASKLLGKAALRGKASLAVTSHDELLALHSRVPLGSLQQRDPVMHLLRRVGVAVEHPVGRDDHERVGSEQQGEKEGTLLSPYRPRDLLESRADASFPAYGQREEKRSAICYFTLRQILLLPAGFYFMCR